LCVGGSEIGAMGALSSVRANKTTLDQCVGKLDLSHKYTVNYISDPPAGSATPAHRYAPHRQARITRPASRRQPPDGRGRHHHSHNQTPHRRPPESKKASKGLQRPVPLVRQLGRCPSLNRMIPTEVSISWTSPLRQNRQKILARFRPACRPVPPGATPPSC
jgi:hypothetical protein